MSLLVAGELHGPNVGQGWAVAGRHRTAATGKKVKTPGWGGAGPGGTQAAAGTRHTPVNYALHLV